MNPSELPEKPGEPDRELFFDFVSGQLGIKPKAEAKKPNEVVVDQIYKDGFF